MNFSTITLLCLMLFLHISFELQLEVSLNDRYGSKVKAKIMCVPKEKNVHNNKEQQIWWQGSKFGTKERNRLRQEIPDETFIPEVRVNSTNSYQCFLMSPKSNIDKDHLRKRLHREIAASVPAEFGNCSPGYRLHEDKCFPCPPGTFTSGQETHCNLCPRNFFNSKEAADSCFPCPEARKTLVDGADSEDLCVYVDPSGRPVSTLSTKLLVIGICAAIFIVVAWILIGLYLYWWCREKKLKRTTDDETWWNFRHLWKNLFRKGQGKDSAEDHIYAEIEDDNTYLELLPDDNTYLEILPDDNTYLEILPDDNDGYEVPKKPDQDNTYTEIIPDDDGYEVPIKPNYDDHVYEAISDSEDYNVQEQPNHSTSTSRSRDSNSSSNAPPSINNDYYYVNKGSTMIIHKTSKPKQDDTENVIVDDDFDQLYADTDATPTAREHRDHLPKTESYGFQPLLSSAEEEGRLAVKKSDYNQLAKMVLRTSKSETDTWAGNQVPNLEELGFDVAKLSKVMEKLSQKSRPDVTSGERLEVPSRSRIAQERRISEDIVELPKAVVLRNVLKGRESQEMSLRAEDFDFKKSYVKDGKSAGNVRKSSMRVPSESKAQKSTSLPHKSRSRQTEVEN